MYKGTLITLTPPSLQLLKSSGNGSMAAKGEWKEKKKNRKNKKQRNLSSNNVTGQNTAPNTAVAGLVCLARPRDCVRTRHSHLRKWNAPRVCGYAKLAFDTPGEKESLLLCFAPPGFWWLPWMALTSTTRLPPAIPLGSLKRSVPQNVEERSSARSDVREGAV